MKKTFDMLQFVKSTPVPRIVVLGMTRTGKTVFCKKLIQQYIKRHNKIFIIDPKNEFSDVKIFQKDDLYRYKSFIRKILKIHHNNTEYDDSDVLAEFAGALTWHFTPAILYIEEIPELVKKTESLPTSHKLLYKILQQGAAKKAGIIVVSQMLRDLHLSFLRQSSDLFIFGMWDSELRTIEKTLGFATNTFKFELPTTDEKEKGSIKDLYSFYHVSPGLHPDFYEPVKYQGVSNEKNEN